MSSPEYMNIHSKYLSPNIYNLYDTEEFISDDGYVYIKIVYRIYGIKQAPVIA